MNTDTMTVEQVVKAYSKALKAELTAAQKAHDKAASVLDTLRAGLQGHDPINAARWKAVYQSSFAAALAKVYDNPDSRKTALNRIKVAAIALTNRISPETGETLQGFVKRVLNQVKASGAYAPATGGGARPKPKGKAKANAKAKPKATKAEAALILAGGDKADADMILALTKDMKILRAFYTKVDPVK